MAFPAQSAFSKAFKKTSVAACIFGFAALAGATAQADPVADFYHGKEVAITVGSSSGGGFDLYGRLVARHMSGYLPGAPTIVVKNMPGAGGIQQVNYLVNVAVKDGTQLGIINPVMTTAPFLTPEVAKWDSRKFVWLGSANSEISTCAFWKASGISDIDKLINAKRELMVAGIGPSSGSTLDAITLKSMMSWKWNIVTGYPGLANAMNAAEAGEADGMCGLNVTTLKARLWPQIQRGEIHVLLQTSLRNHPDLPGVKNAFDLAKSPEQKQMMELVFGPWIFGRPFITTSGVPAERLAALRKAFKEVLADKQFLAEAEKTQSDISYMPPAEIEGLVERFYATPVEVREKTRQLLDTRS